MDVESSPWRQKKVIGLIFIVVVLFCILATLLLLRVSHQRAPSLGELQTTNEVPVISNSTGSSTDYNLYIKQDIYEQEANWVPEIWYQALGVVEYGPYTGWTRVLGFRGASDPSGGYQNLFITKDGTTFLVDDPYLREDDYSYYNKTVVKGTTTIPHPFPEQLTFGGVMLKRESFVTRDEFSERRGALLTKHGDFTLTEGKLSDRYISTSTIPLVRASTDIFLENKDGVVVSYGTVTVSSYRTAEKYAGGAGGSFVNAQLQFQKDLDYDQELGAPLMSFYGSYFQGGCSHSGAVLDPQFEADLRQIGVAKSGEPIYLFKEKEHTLVRTFYDRKIKSAYESFQAKEPWVLYTADGKETTPPSFDEYKDNNPVIVMKDSLGRYILLGEYYFGTADGCGKPVIYLYTEKYTEVVLSFKNFLSLALDIPKYANGWRVLAHPDGMLNDLQREVTSCHLINSTQHGSEYAGEACKKNQYPYIYWEGVTVGHYPEQKEGLVVKRDDLEKAMDEQLTKLSLSSKERDDMLSFWVPEMKKKKSPYYRISFIQTEEMNTFVPMRVTPKPNSTIRVFLDWEPLNEAISISPQELKTADRKGFVFVEWGGLKR